MDPREADVGQRSLGRGSRVRLKKIALASGYSGHAHFWERALSRRRFMQGTSSAAAGMLLLGSSRWMPASAAVPGNTPKPIPGGFTASGVGCSSSSPEIFHNFGPNVFDPPDTDRSGIFDFKGDIGYAIIDGTGTGRNTTTGATRPLAFDVDLRFMQGAYIGVNGKRREGTFCLI